MSYATADQVRVFLLTVDLTAIGDATAQDTAIDDAADQATTRVDDFTGRTFTDTTEERLFDGSGTSRLFIPDLRSLSGWEIDDESQETAELLLYPLNNSPKEWIVRKVGSCAAAFPPGLANLKITGTWGYAASVPDKIRNACAQLAAAEVLMSLGPTTTSGAATVTQGLLTRQYPEGPYGKEIRRLEENAQRVLGPYVRMSF